MVNQFVKGATYPFTGLRWLTRPRLRRFVIVPFLINTVLFAGAIWWLAKRFGQWMEQLMVWLVGWMPSWLDWLATLVGGLLWLLFALAIPLVVFYTFTLVANLLAAPFNGLLAEKVEDLADPGRTRPAGRPLWQEIVIAPGAELRKLAYFLVRALPLLLLFVIPLVNVAAPFIWVLFGAWMLALQYADYPMGNHTIPFRDQRRILSERRMLALGFGAAVLAITLVPVLNFLAMPASVIGATLMWVEQFPERRQAVPAPPSI